MAKASRVLTALKRDGWRQVRRTGSHRRLRKGADEQTFAFHERVDLGRVQLQQVAQEFGYTLEQLRKMI